MVVVAVAALGPHLNACPLTHALVVALDSLGFIARVQHRHNSVPWARLGALGLVVVKAEAALGVSVGALGGGHALVVAGGISLRERDGGDEREETEEEGLEVELHGD